MNPQFPLTYLIPPLIGATLLGGLMGLVLLKVRHRPEGLAFSLVLLSLALWQALTFLMRNSPDPAHALFYERLLIFTLFGAVAAFYFFTLQYTRTRDHRGMGAGWGLVVAASLLSSTSLVVQGMELRSYGYEPIWGPAFPVLALAGFLLAAHGTARLYQVAKTAPTYEERNQLRYILASILVVLLGLLIDALLMLYPAGIIGGLVFASATAVALLRFHLLDIRVALREALSAVLAGLILAFPFVALTTLLERVMGASGLVVMLFPLTMVAVGAAAIVLWKQVRQKVERLFYGRRFHFLIALRNFSAQPHSIASGRELAHGLVGLVAPAVGAEKVCLALPEGRGYAQAACFPPDSRACPGNWTLSREGPLLRWLETHNAPLRASDIETHLQFQGLTSGEHSLLQQGVELFVPLKYNRTLSGILMVGSRASGEPYSSEDLCLLTQTTTQVATTFYGARVLSEQKQVAEEMARLSRLRLEFIATLAHEFKTPLTALKAAVELLEQPQVTEEVRGRVIASLKHNFSRLEGMVMESLKLAQLQADALELKREPLNVRHIVEETALALAPVVSSKGQSIAVEALGRLPRASADRARLQDILCNLMGNAVKFSPQEARIGVCLHRREGELIVEVTDEATPLSPQEQENIFDPHHRAKKGMLGGGLGLAIAKGLVEQHGGKIWVNSGQEKGNLFGFSIPLWVSKQNGGQAE